MKSMVARDPRKVYAERFIFMAALLIPSVFLCGARAAVVCVLSVLLCMLTDYVCCKLRHIRYDIKDTAVLFWGLSAAMLMPVSIPYALVALSSVICVALGKHVFGGSENIIFSPSAISIAFLIICYPSDMLYYPKSGEIFPVFGEFAGVLTHSAEYSLKHRTIPSGTILDILLGNAVGAIGAVNVLIILVCGICLLIRRSSSISAVIPCLVTMAALAFAFPRADYSGLESIFYELTSGFALFGILFLSAEPYNMPKHRWARVMYGVTLGYIIMMIRFLGQTEGGFVFALLITNALSTCYDTIVDNLHYWKKSYLSTFETSKNDAQRGTTKLSDTQEIKIPKKYLYNRPPIEGKVKKRRSSDAGATIGRPNNDSDSGSAIGRTQDSGAPVRILDEEDEERTTEQSQTHDIPVGATIGSPQTGGAPADKEGSDE